MTVKRRDFLNTQLKHQGQIRPVSDRLAIVNALISQDRSEIREHQTALFHLTYVVIAGSIGIAALLVDHPKYKSVLILGQGLLLALYSAAFFAFRGWLADARACLEVRQSFYRQQELLRANPFTHSPCPCCLSMPLHKTLPRLVHRSDGDLGPR